MKKIVIFLSVMSLMMTSLFTQAAEKEIRATLKRLNIDATGIAKIEDIPLKDWKKVSVPDGTFYVSTDGNYFISGAIFDVRGNIPQELGRPSNLEMIQTIKNEAITFKAPNSKYDIYVFTDHTCVFCKRFHNELQSYLDKGISVHYLAFPRMGVDNKEAKMLQSAWNAKDPKKALNDLFDGKTLPLANDTKQIARQRAIAITMGATGTPAIVFGATGELVPGYVPADTLIQYLQ